MSCPRAAALLLLLAPALPAAAGEATVAVAANFAATARAATAAVEAGGVHRFRLVVGSTGKLHAQIVSGAPFDLFLAADAASPAALEAAGRAVPGSRVTYALGALVLWCPELPGCDGDTLASGSFRHLAIANPELAPYGAAAIDTLRSLGLMDRLAPRLVRGDTVAQAFHYVASGAAELGLVARSQLVEAGHGPQWPVPPELHVPIAQDAVLLTANPAAAALLAWLTGSDGRRLVVAHGYELPPLEAAR
jgi:molybdate transport system substrate-binding protein